MIVLPGMFIFRRIAASDMTAGQTHSQVNPGIARLLTLLAAVRSWRNILSLIKMCACWHEFHLKSFSLRLLGNPQINRGPGTYART